MANTEKSLILAIDQGTTATKALLIDRRGRILGVERQTIRQIYPRPGWVEMDPDQLWNSITDTVARLLRTTGTSPEAIAAIGLSNQGETVIAWDRESGRHLHNAISWQCTRTEKWCRQLAGETDERWIQEKTGLRIESYFSASKLGWLLRHADEARKAQRRGTLLLGNLDAWMLWKISGGAVYATDHTTASRTLLFNVHDLDWDDDLLNLFGVEQGLLPKPRPPIGELARSEPGCLAGIRAPVTASAVDQPAALFGHGCRRRGDLKVTYGTGAFLLMHTGSSCIQSRHGLLASIGIGLPGEDTAFYLDGGIYSAGALIEWLCGLGLLAEPAETASLAGSVPDSGGVFFVPALVGLAAPHWQRKVHGAFFGLGRDTTRAHLVRAVLESIAFRVLEVVRAMEQDAGLASRDIRVDGGLSQNDFLMRFQADLLARPLFRPENSEITGLGIGLAAGLGAGLPVRQGAQSSRGTTYSPSPSPPPGNQFRHWRHAVALAREFDKGQ